MADALLSPTTGIVLWAASAGALAVSARRVRQQDGDRLVPLMGVLGAFVFAAQMINFAIPATGSSGHLGGGLLLAALLGPHAALVVIASILTVQALFFADGGLLALGANIFNVGVLPCLVAYPLVFRPLAGDWGSPARVAVASLVAAIVALQLGALGVVIQTTASGIVELPLAAFALLMLPIHLAIGIGEGLATAALLLFLARARPDLLRREGAPTARRSVPLLAGFTAAALVAAMALSWFASPHPDGLEWSIEHVAPSGLQQAATPLHLASVRVQQATAVLPDYQWPREAAPADDASWPAIDPATSAAGFIGSVLTVLAVWALGFLIRRGGR